MNNIKFYTYCVEMQIKENILKQSTAETGKCKI